MSTFGGDQRVTFGEGEAETLGFEYGWVMKPSNRLFDEIDGNLVDEARDMVRSGRKSWGNVSWCLVVGASWEIETCWAQVADREYWGTVHKDSGPSDPSCCGLRLAVSGRRPAFG